MFGFIRHLFVHNFKTLVGIMSMKSGNVRPTTRRASERPPVVQRSRRWFSATAAAAAAAESCETTTSPVAFLPHGTSLHADVADWPPADPELTRRLDDLTERLLRANPSAEWTLTSLSRAGPDARWTVTRRFRLVVVADGDDRPYAYSDVAAAVVIVSAGMVRLLDDAELMMVLGHELAHFLIGDQRPPGLLARLARLQRTRWRPAALDRLPFYIAVLRCATVTGRPLTTALAVLAVCTTAYLVSDRWATEHRADRMAVEMAVAAGADPSVGRSVFEKPEIRRADGARTWFPRLTHPSVGARLRAMRRFQDESDEDGPPRRGGGVRTVDL